MINRKIILDVDHSFFLFGARGTGKSTLLKSQNFLSKDTMWIDLLNPSIEEKYSLHPEFLTQEIDFLSKKPKWVVIDEIQKVPKLLDVVHQLIESTEIQFVLTGSSSRKLKRIGSNLLAGRAFNFKLFPMTSLEVGKSFNIHEHINWGGLPKIYNLKNINQKSLYLKSYVENYLKEEIIAEQILRNLNPFRLFLPLCMQNETEPLNFTKIAEQTGVETKTIQNYYEILCDTHLGFFLNPYDKSVRSVQKRAPKFYFFDTGVHRAIEKKLKITVESRSSEFGKLFESWFINEVHRYNEYFQLDYHISYLRTKDDAEIDLIIERPDGSISLVEIKSSEVIEDRHLKHLISFKKDFPNADLVCISNEKKARKVNDIQILPWKSSFKYLKLTC